MRFHGGYTLMRKVLPFLGASLSVLAISLAAPSHAQDAKLFQDVPQSHWAYESVSDLQTKGILLGYPDGYFRGKRPLTRYEFAVALERMLQEPAARSGWPRWSRLVLPALRVATGEVGPPGVTPEELAAFPPAGRRVPQRTDRRSAPTSATSTAAWTL